MSTKSPVVVINETDASSVAIGSSSKRAAIAGPALWGPVGEPTLVSSEAMLVSIFGKPTSFNAETFFTAANYLAYSNALYFVRVVDGAVAATSSGSSFEAKYQGDLGNSLLTSYAHSGDAFEKSLTSVGDMAGTFDFFSSTLEMTAADDLSADIVVGEKIKIGNDSVGYQTLTVESVAAIASGSDFVHTIVFAENYRLREEDLSKLLMTRVWRFASLFGKQPSSGRVHIVVQDEDGKFSGIPGTVLETFSNVSLVEGAKLENGVSNFWKNRIASSAYVKATSIDIPSSSLTPVTKSYTGGLNGHGENTSTVISFASVAAGYDLFMSGDYDVRFVLQGKARYGVNETGLANYLVSNIAEVKRNCVAIVSPSYELTVATTGDNAKLTNVLSFRSSLQSSSYMMVDIGYKYQYDKYNDVYRWIPLNGDTAGLLASVESYESPGNGVLKNAAKLDFNTSEAQRDVLYASDINAYVNKNSKGIVLYGDKTAYGEDSSAFSRINVRMLFIDIRESVKAVSETYLFKNNTDYVQTQFRNSVEPMLRSLQSKGGINSYKIVADSTVNTAQVLAENKFVAKIYIDPPRSINEIGIDLVAVAPGAIELSEF